MRYTDPTGHWLVENPDGGSCTYVACLPSEPDPPSGGIGGNSNNGNQGTPPASTNTPQPQNVPTPAPPPLATPTAPPNLYPYWQYYGSFTDSMSAEYLTISQLNLDLTPDAGPADIVLDIDIPLLPNLHITDLPTMTIDLGDGIGFQTVMTTEYDVYQLVEDVPGGGQVVLETSTGHGIPQPSIELVLPNSISVEIIWPSVDLMISSGYP